MKKWLIGILVVVTLLAGCTAAASAGSSESERFTFQIIADTGFASHTLITDTQTGRQYIEVRTIKGVAITPLGD